MPKKKETSNAFVYLLRQGLPMERAWGHGGLAGIDRQTDNLENPSASASNKGAVLSALQAAWRASRSSLLLAFESSKLGSVMPTMSGFWKRTKSCPANLMRWMRSLSPQPAGSMLSSYLGMNETGHGHVRGDH